MSIVNLGTRLKVLTPSPVDADPSMTEISVTTIAVSNLRRGMVVVEIDADSFSALLNEQIQVRQEHYVVLSAGSGDKVLLQNMKDKTSCCLRDPRQIVHVMNTFGISNIGSMHTGSVTSIALCAPGDEGVDVLSKPPHGSSSLPPVLGTATLSFQDAAAALSGKAQAEKVATFVSDWKCSTCTVLNSSHLTICDCCGIAKPLESAYAYTPGSIGQQLSAMGIEDIKIQMAIARFSTVGAALEWIYTESDSVIERMKIASPGKNLPADCPPPPPPAPATGGVLYGAAPPVSEMVIGRSTSNPFEEGSMGFQLWRMGYKDKKLVEDSLARSSRIEGAVTWILEKQGGSDLDHVERTYLCPIYGDEVTVDQLHIFDCPSSHQCSFYAAFMDVVRSIAPHDAHSEGAFVPACPIRDCNTVLEQDEILRIIDRGYAERLHEQPDFTPFLRGKTQEQLKDTAKALIFKRANQLLGFMRCPACHAADGSEFWFAPDPGLLRIVCPNPTCGREFCSSCNLSPYHYHCSCAEVVQYTRAWNDWCEGGRNSYVAEMNAQDKDFAKRKAEFDRAQQHHASEVAAARRNYDILVQDEQSKAQTCKLCPHCKKIVWKLDGCNSMTCGRDASDKGGGNVQNGCGKGFNWLEAKPYQPNIGTAPTAQELKIAPPQEAQKVRHEIYAGQERFCDICHEPIVGPLIKCLNCPAFYYCLKCNSTNKKHWTTGQSHIGIVCFENNSAN